MEHHRSVVLLSGGMDSTTVLAQALADGAPYVLCISFQYGSKHGARELEAAQNVVSYYRERSHEVDHLVVNLPRIFGGGGSALMDDVPMPHGEYKDPEKEGPSSTEVPFRNANLLSAATSIAMTHQCTRVYFAAHANDATRWAYPDCTPEFIGAMASAIYIGTMHRVRLVAPFMYMTKGDVVTRAALLDAPLHLTWSCYEGMLQHCGTCPTCVERMHAFADAGFADPVPYLTAPAWENFEVWPTLPFDEDTVWPEQEDL